MFEPFSPFHFLLLGALLALTGVAILIRRRLSPQAGKQMDHTLAGITILVWVAATAWWMLPSKWDRQYAWPIHMCDLAGLAAFWALWTSGRRSRTILHYWGLGLCSQAIITPTLRDPITDPGFWLFWIMHALIIGPGLYDLFARGYRPTWRDARFCIAVSLLYAAFVIPIDIVFDVNYGYLGPRTPDNPTLLDKLGPWPARAVILMIGVIVVVTMMTVPWEIARRRRAGRA